MKISPVLTAFASALLWAGAASAGQWTYYDDFNTPYSYYRTLRHNTTPWGFNVTVNGTELTITSVATRAESPSALPLGDALKGYRGADYTITAIADGASFTSGMFFGYYYSSPGYHIQSLTLPATLKTIGNYAFTYCSGLTGALTIPDSVTRIGSGAFESCSGLTGALTIGNSVTSIGDSAFAYCRGLTGALTIPDSVTTIGNSAFTYCSGLTGALTIPGSVTSIGDGAFSGCSGLTGALTIPGSVTNISSSAFAGCSGLTGVTIPGSVTSIGYAAFYDSSGLTGVTIPDSVTNIGDSAFANCSGLTGALTIPDSVATIGDSAFRGCTSLTDIAVSAGNAVYESIDGVLFNKGATTLICYPAGKAGAYSIPSGVTSIGDSAFAHCRGLTDVIIPDSVTDIGDAFSNCSGLTGILFEGGCPASISSSIYLYSATVYIHRDRLADWEGAVTGSLESGTAVWQGRPIRVIDLVAIPSSLSISPDAGSRTFTVFSDPDAWTLTKDAYYYWLTVSPSSGGNKTEVTVTAEANRGTTSRSATITLFNGDITRIVSVTQPAAALTVAPSAVSLDAGGGSETFAVSANVSWALTSGGDWLTAAPASGTDSAEVTLTASANPWTDPRSATITVTGGGFTRTVTVTQAGAEATLTASPSSVSFGAGAGNQTFMVSGNVPWTVEENAEWLSVSPASGSGNGTVTVTALANTGTAQRSATVTVTGGGFTRTVTVTQAGASVTPPPPPPSPASTGYLSGPADGTEAVPPTAATAYAGFAYDDGGAMCGTVTLTAKESKGVWTYTAKIVLQGGSVSLSKKGAAPDGPITLDGKSGEKMTVTLGEGTLSGTLTGGSVSGTLRIAGARDAFADKKDTAATTRLNALKGYYTAALVGVDGTAGYLTLTVGNLGSVKIAGKLSDGTAVSGSTKMQEGLNKDGWLCIALHKPLYSKKGSVGGLLWLDPVTKVLRVDTDYGWFIDWTLADTSLRPLDVCGGWYGTGAALAPSYLFSADVPTALPPFIAGLTSGAWITAAFPHDVPVEAASGKLTIQKGVAAKKPAKDAATPDYVYDAANPSCATISLAAKTGIFKGGFKLYYADDGAHGFQHKAASVSYIGVLTPKRDASYAAWPVGLGSGTVKIGQEKVGISVELKAN